MPPLVSQHIHRAGTWLGDHDSVSLSYGARFLRRRMLTTTKGTRFLADLAQTTSLDHGDAFELQGGTLIEVVAAREDLIEITGPDLVRIAWHIGNRHTPCQIEPGRLLIQRDHVMQDMLGKLGTITRNVSEPFTPEGGAYGHGRTHGHDHTASHGHSHTHEHEHEHEHEH